jgi:hypothetical protein
MNAVRRFSPYLILWSALLFVFFAVGVPRFWRDIRARTIPPNEPFVSLDDGLEKQLSVRGAAALLHDHLARLPANARILFVVPKSDDDTWDFLYGVTSYLSWPRTLEKKTLRPNEPVTVDAANVDVLICCGIAVPPEFTPQWSLGPKFVWSERR